MLNNIFFLLSFILLAITKDYMACAWVVVSAIWYNNYLYEKKK